MNPRILALLSMLTLFSGCIVHSNNNNYYGANGNVTFSWTFAGRTCNQATDVASVTVDIAGQVSQPNTFNCLTNNYPGITLTNFDGGQYSFTVTAYDSQGTPLYSQSGTFVVDGDVTVPVDLAPTSNANSYAFLSWTFGAAQNPRNAPVCGNAQGGDIPTMKITIDGVSQDYNCIDGLGAAAVQTDYLSAGTHSVVLDAVLPASDPANDFVFAEAVGTLVTTAGAPTSQSFTLNWEVGGAAVNWTFYDGATQYPTCAAAGVTTIRVNFYDPSTQSYVYGSQGDVFPCPADNGNVVLYQSLPAGSFQVVVDAYNDNGSIVYSNTADIPTANIQSGVFVTAASQPNPPIALDLQ